MIFVCGSVSSSSLIDAARPTVSGRIVPGKTTKLRNGRMERTSGIWGDDVAAAPPIAVDSGGADLASLPSCKAISGSSFMISVAAKSRGDRCAARHLLFRYPLMPENELRARTAQNKSPWRAIARRVPLRSSARAPRGHLEEQDVLARP